jgi:hypothetical protein
LDHILPLVNSSGTLSGEYGCLPESSNSKPETSRHWRFMSYW